MAQTMKRGICFCLIAGLLAGWLPGNLFSLPAKAAETTFADVDKHWAQQAISRWADRGVLTGRSATIFDPDAPITRAEFFAVVNRVMGAFQMADISLFYDVSRNDWFYDDVAKALAMGTTTGTSASTMSPNSQITRQEAAVILARLLGLGTENTSALSQFTDNGAIAEYARPHLADMVTRKYISGYPNGTIRPADRLTRAMAVTMIDNIVRNVYTGLEAFNGTTLEGTLLTNAAGSSFVNMTVNGDLIVGDGVGSGNVSLMGCQINGKLILRGGGPNSVTLSGTKVSNGIFVWNPSCDTRVSLQAGSDVGAVTGRTGVILEGEGASAFFVPEDAAPMANYSLSGVSLDYMDVSGPGVKIVIQSGTVADLRFFPTANNARCYIDADSKADAVYIDAQNVKITGSGSIGGLTISAQDADVEQEPEWYEIGDDISAVIAGETVYGLTANDALTNVSRSSSGMKVLRDSDPVGGDGISLTTGTKNTGANVVTITQREGESVPLTDLYRLGYWMGFFIPAPNGYNSPLDGVQYAFDGLPATSTSENISTQGGVKGLLIYLPVTRTGEDVGQMNQRLFIQWDGRYREAIYFTGTNVKLTPPSQAQQAELLDYYRYANFYGMERDYEGVGAIQRLLLSDNALGLNLSAYTTLPKSDQGAIAASLNQIKSMFTTKKAIEDRLLIECSGKGALYAINRAVSVEHVQMILEDTAYAAQLGIQMGEGSKYYMLSQSGREAVARAILAGRGNDYPSEDAVRTVFAAKVDELRGKETALINTINNTKTREEMQKILETKANADLIGIIIDYDPYKSLTAADRLAVAKAVLDSAPYLSLDVVREIFVENVGEPKEPVPEDDTNILSIDARPEELTLAVGDFITIEPVITTASGSFTSVDAVKWAVDKSSIVAVEATSGTVTALAKGTANVTLTSVKDTKKNKKLKVTVVQPVASTGITLSKTKAEVTVGESIPIVATLIPSNSTDRIIWSCDDAKIATVVDGKVTGLSAGFTNVTARTASGFSASCQLAVLGNEPGVIIDKSEITIGIRSSGQLAAAVSPLGVANRTVLWSSDNLEVATVDASGKVTGVSGGETIIRAKSAAYPAAEAQCRVTVDPNLRAIYLDKESIVMYKNGVDQLSATLLPSGDASKEVDWNLSQTSNVISLGKDENGNNNSTITALNPGKATVIASLKSNPSVMAFCEIEVSSANLTATLNAKTASINIGDDFMLTVTFNPTQVSNTKISFTSANTDIASVDGSGKITGKKKGTVRITVVPDANRSIQLTCDVTVKEIALTSFEIPPKMTIYRKEKRTIQVNYTPPNASDKAISIFSPDQSKVLAFENYIQGEGTTLVEEDVQKVLNGEPVFEYPAATPENPEPAPIPVMEKKMVDYPITIRVTASNGKSQDCMVTVLDKDYDGSMANMMIVMDTWVYKVGGTQNLTVLFNVDEDGVADPDNQPNNPLLNWSSTDTSVATVDGNGRLVAKAPGSTVITVTSEDSARKAERTIYVAGAGLSRVEEFVGISANQQFGNWLQMDLGLDKNKSISARIQPEDATNQKFIWYSENPAIVSASGSGGAQVELTAQSVGVALVTLMPAPGSTVYSSARLSSVPKADLWLSGVTYDEDLDEYYDPDLNLLDGEKVYALALPDTFNEKTGNNTFKVWVAPSAPNALTIDQSAPKTVDVGDAVILTATAQPVNAAVALSMPQWSSSDNSILNVASASIVNKDNKSTMTSVASKEGTVTVTVTMKLDYTEMNLLPILATDPTRLTVKGNEVTASYIITVRPVPVASTAVKTSTYAWGYTGEAIQLNAELLPNNATYKTVTWQSSDTNVAEVDDTGLVSLKAAGTANITAKPSDAGSSGAVLTPLTVTSLGSPAIDMNATFSCPQEQTLLPVRVLPAYPAGAVRPAMQISYTVTPQGAAAITPDDALGVYITPNSTDAFTVRASVTVGGQTYTKDCEVTVLTAFGASVGEVDAYFSLNAGQSSFPLAALSVLVPPEQAGEASYTTSDASVATVDQGGVVTAHSNGNALITATTTGSTAEVLITVGDAKPGRPGRAPAPEPQPSEPDKETLTGLKLPSAVTLFAGDQLALEVYTEPAGAPAEGLIWKSSSERVATVKNGVVTAGDKADTCTISVTSADGTLKASCEVTVRIAEGRPVTGISLNQDTFTVGIGQKVTAKAEVIPANAAITDVTWSSSDEKVATVSPTGVITGVGGGECIITARSRDGGFTASALVSVVMPVQSVAFAEKEITLKVGESRWLSYSITPANAENQNVSFRTNLSTICTVTQDGMITAHKAGKAMITITTEDGKKTATCIISVK